MQTHQTLLVERRQGYGNGSSVRLLERCAGRRVTSCYRPCSQLAVGSARGNMHTWNEEQEAKISRKLFRCREQPAFGPAGALQQMRAEWREYSQRQFP